MTWRCPKGHESTESDYCSVCGVAIAPDPVAAPATASVPVCPSCGEPRTDPAAHFCEVCRYDFATNAPGPAPIGTPAPAITSSPSGLAPAPAPMPVPAPPTPIWELRISVDPLLDTDPDPDFPAPQDEPEYGYPIDGAKVLLGRRDDRQDIRPDLPLHDPGVSRRHARIVRSADGGLAVEDLDSTNGTSVNGKLLPPGLRRVLHDGDRVTLGRWTRITVHGDAS